MNDKLSSLYHHLGYVFQKQTLITAALSHRSVGNKNNERLEFLGDSALNFIISAELYRRFPTAKEGELSRLRASLVKGETLAQLAKEFSLGDYIRLGPGELKSGGFRRASILADALEAIVGAIYLDAGFVVCEQCVLRWFSERLEASHFAVIGKDPKTQLQEYLQSRHLPLPVYKILAVEGQAHAQTFYVECRVDALQKVTLGVANNRRKAEQIAAKLLFEAIDE